MGQSGLLPQFKKEKHSSHLCVFFPYYSVCLKMFFYWCLFIFSVVFQRFVFLFLILEIENSIPTVNSHKFCNAMQLLVAYYTIGFRGFFIFFF